MEESRGQGIMKLSDLERVKKLNETLKDFEIKIQYLTKRENIKVSVSVTGGAVASHNKDLITTVNALYVVHLQQEIKKVKDQLQELGVEVDE